MTLKIALPEGLPPVPRDYAGSFSAEDADALLAPGRVGSMEVRCRVVLPAMESNLGTKDGRVTERLIRYYEARARGGVAWVTTENTSVHRTGRVTSGMLRIETDEEGALFGPLAERIHAAGAGFLVQLSHAGRQTLAEFAGEAPWAPSPIACPVMKDEPRAMTDADVHELIEAFVAGARRAKQAGADGVELHMAHGYLLGGFLSPDQNHRDDAWGGDVERRCAFPTAVIREIKRTCGPQFVVIARFSADEYVVGGMEPDEAVDVGRRLVDAGADALHVSACNYESMFWNIPSYFLPEAPFVSLAAQLRAAVDVPIISVGRLHRPEVAARALRKGSADFVALGRALIADPEIVNRIREDRVAAIRPCLACNRCIASINGATLECTVNPHIGHEGSAWRTDSRRFVVVGGGVAGLAAAAFAHAAGGHVTLIEARDELGGQLDVAAMPPGKEPVGWLRTWWLRRVEALVGARLRIELGREATAADLADADVLIWAAGSRPRGPRLDGDDAVTHVPLDDAMRDPASAGERPLVVGAGPGGAEGAHWLAHQGADVGLVEKRRKIGMGLLPSLRYHLVEELKHEGVEMLTGVKGVEFDGADATVTQRKTEAALADRTAIVDAAGRAAVPLPESLLAGFAGEVWSVGDAAEPGSIFEALTAAAKLFRA